MCNLYREPFTKEFGNHPDVKITEVQSGVYAYQHNILIVMLKEFFGFLLYF